MNSAERALYGQSAGFPGTSNQNSDTAASTLPRGSLPNNPEITSRTAGAARGNQPLGDISPTASQVPRGVGPSSNTSASASALSDRRGRAGDEAPSAADASHARGEAPHWGAVTVAWVLLFGSAAGNFYLFWSYLDVRSKYQAVIRQATRTVASRMPAA